jgi:glycosyltransferase involved in cell wall biosynthesis
MRIAVVHSFYDSRNTSGENFVVVSQVELMRSFGHEVRLFDVYTDALIDQPFYRVKTAVKVASGIGLNPLEGIREFHPDVTIVHNLFPNFGSRWLKNWQGVVIQVLHNYRLFCANGIFFRNGEICFDCVTKSPLEAIKNSCYRDSKVATIPLFIAQTHRSIKPFMDNGTTRFLALSSRAKSILVSAGMNESKILIVPNYIEDFMTDRSEVLDKSNNRWIAVGRITREKGFYNLVKNWPPEVGLDIVGDGEDLESVKKIAAEKSNIRFIGQMQKSDLLERLPVYSGAIHPSIWSEVCPLTLIEFLCAGLPVITLEATSGSFVGNPDSPAGVVLKDFTPQFLTLAINQILQDRSKFSRNARLTYLTDHTPQMWMDSMERIFDQLGVIPE